MSYSESISSFMKWASQRIAKEVEDNEKLEKLTGTRTVIPLTPNQRYCYLTKDDKLSLIEAIDKLRDKGMKAPKASKEYGLHHCTYAKWRRMYDLGRYKKK